VVDAVFANPRLADMYDQLDEPHRPDLASYLALAGELGVSKVVDIGCGTGTLACRLAERGVEVTAVDPASSSLDVARQKPGAEGVHWVDGDVSALSALQVDLVTMTGNVAQIFLTDDEWSAVLSASQRALRPGGRLVFEVRDPKAKGWLAWTRDQTHRIVDLPNRGEVEVWTDLLDVDLPLVSFRQYFVFRADGTTLRSDSTLRFREESEILASLAGAGFDVEEVRGADDRPGLELVFVATRR
jgi:ubiquinone/menaquinone biosynthesis C-methylase UbiE